MALQNEEVVGTISLLDIGDHLAALRKMFVHRDYRGTETGTALKLLKIALSWSANQSLQTIYLGTIPKFLEVHRFFRIYQSCDSTH